MLFVTPPPTQLSDNSADVVFKFNTKSNTVVSTTPAKWPGTSDTFAFNGDVVVFSLLNLKTFKRDIYRASLQSLGVMPTLITTLPAITASYNYLGTMSSTTFTGAFVKQFTTNNILFITFNVADGVEVSRVPVGKGLCNAISYWK